MDGQCIILYSTSTCTRCMLVKQMLDAHNVEYKEIKDNKQLITEKDLESVPALDINGEIIDDYSLVLNWLQKNGYYSL